MDHISHIASQGTFGLLSLIFYSNESSENEIEPNDEKFVVYSKIQISHETNFTANGLHRDQPLVSEMKNKD